MHLESCVYVIDTNNWNNEKMYEEIKKRLFQRDVSNQAEVIRRNRQISSKIFKKLSKGQPLSPTALLDDMSEDEQLMVQDVIRELVSANILRYDIKGYITWHSQIQYHEFRDCSQGAMHSYSYLNINDNMVCT